MLSRPWSMIVCLTAILLVFAAGCERKGTRGIDTGLIEGGLFVVIGGEGRYILSGDDTPATEDRTDFGVHPPDSSPVVVTYRMTNSDNSRSVTLMPDGQGRHVRIIDDDGGVFRVTRQPGEDPMNPGAAAGAVTIGPRSEEDFRISFSPTGLAVYTARIEFTYIDFNGAVQTYWYAIKARSSYRHDQRKIRVSGRELAVSDEDWVPIPNGARNPQIVDGTDYGALDWNDALGSNRTYLIENLGGRPLTISDVSLNARHPDDWMITLYPNLTELPGYVGTGEVIGGSTSFEISFAPRTASSDIFRTATVTIRSNDGSDDPYTFQIMGSVWTPDIYVTGEPGVELLADGSQPASEALGTDFGMVTINGARARVFTIRNLGNGRLHMVDSPPVTVIGDHRGDFSFNFNETENSLGPLDDPVYPNQTTFEVIFRPQDLGVRNATLLIPSNDPDEPQTYIQIKGEGYPAALELFGDDRATPALDWNPIFYVHETMYGKENLTSEHNSTRWAATNVRQTGATHWFRIVNPAASGKRLVFDGSQPIFPVGMHASDFLIVSHPRASTVVDAAGVPIGDPVTALEPGEEAFFALAFRPTAYGTRRAVLGIRHSEHVIGSDPLQILRVVDPFVFEVAGLGLAPDIRVFGHTGFELKSGDPNPSLAAGTEMPRRLPIITDGYNIRYNGRFRVGSYGSVIFTIENVGNAPLVFTGSPRVELAGAFANAFYVPRAEHISEHYYKSIGHPEPNVSSLEPNETATFELFYDPIRLGYNQATVTIRSNDPDEEAFSFEVRCYGVDPKPVMLGRNNIILDEDVSPRVLDYTRFPVQDGGTDWGDYLGANETRFPNPWLATPFLGDINDPNTFENENSSTAAAKVSFRFAIRSDGDGPLEIDHNPAPAGSDFGYKVLAGEPSAQQREYVRLGAMGQAMSFEDQAVTEIDPNTPLDPSDDYPVVNRPGRYWEEFDGTFTGFWCTNPVFCPDWINRVWVISPFPRPSHRGPAGSMNPERQEVLRHTDTGSPLDGLRAFVERMDALDLEIEAVVAIGGLYEGFLLPRWVDDDDVDAEGGAIRSDWSGGAIPNPDMKIWRIGDAVNVGGTAGTVVYVGDNFVALDRRVTQSFEYVYGPGPTFVGTAHGGVTARFTQADFRITEQPKPSRFDSSTGRWQLDPGQDTYFSVQFYPRWCNYDANPATEEYDPPFTPQGDRVSIYQGNRANNFTGDYHPPGFPVPATPHLIYAYRYDENEEPIDLSGDGVIDEHDLRPIDLEFMQRALIHFRHNSIHSGDDSHQPFPRPDYYHDHEYNIVIKGRTKFTDVQVYGFGELPLAIGGDHMLGDAHPADEIRIPDKVDNLRDPSDQDQIFIYNNDFGDLPPGQSKAMFFRIENTTRRFFQTMDFFQGPGGRKVTMMDHQADDPLTGDGWPINLVSTGTTVVGTEWIRLSNTHSHDYRVYTRMEDFLAEQLHRPAIDPTTEIEVVNGSPVAIEDLELLQDRFIPATDAHDRYMITIPDGEDAFFIVEYVPSTYGFRYGNFIIPTDHGQKANYSVPLRGGSQVGGDG